MTESAGVNGIYFIYDGECPLCTKAALALRIKQDYGSLHLIDARQHQDHPLVQRVSELNLDLDGGMVLYDGIQFYHGKDALRFMARYADAKNLFNSALKSLYWSDMLARATYPVMRAIRNWLLARNNKLPIDNLDLKSSPIFKPVFGDSWNDLPSVMHRHYANHPYSGQSSRVEGILDVHCAGPVKWFAPLFWLMKGIPPRNEKNVLVTVDFKSDPSSKAFYLDRVFNFQDRKPYRFRSRMIPTRGNEVVEIMASQLGWRMRVTWEDGRVKLKHKDYVVHLFGCFVPLPLTALLGAGNAEEIAIDEQTFEMSVAITHPLWGNVYGYKGRFKTPESE